MRFGVADAPPLQDEHSGTGEAKETSEGGLGAGGTSSDDRDLSVARLVTSGGLLAGRGGVGSVAPGGGAVDRDGNLKWSAA